MAGLLGFTLADLTGAVDSRKRQYGNMVRGLLSDPKALMEQLSAQDAEAAQRNRYTQASAGSVMPEVAQQGQQAMMDAALNVGGLLGITAFHGSPHKFDKFDMSKIGTGEGAQAYGHGLYFAENPKVAKDYAHKLSNDSYAVFKPQQGNYIEQDILGSIASAQDAVGKAVIQKKDLVAAIKDRHKYGEVDNSIPLPDYLKYVDELQKAGRLNFTKQSGNLYKVDIPDDAVAKMLDWDKPLSQQPEAVRNALQKSWLAHPDVDGKLTGAQIYQRAGITLQGKEGTQAAAEQLRAAGIPGIRYLDAGSRGKGGTSNFVLFDDNLPKILSRE